MALIPIGSTWYEIIESESPTQASFSSRNASTIVTTFLVDGTEIVDFVNDVIGTSRLVNNSHVSRTIPASHPLLPWLYATKITDIKGYSPNGKGSAQLYKDNSTYKNLETRSPEFVGSYQKYKVTVQYEARSYSIITDEDLVPFHERVGYSMPVRNARTRELSERRDEYLDRKEYLRYTSWNVQPVTEFLTWGAGNFVGINTDGEGIVNNQGVFVPQFIRPVQQQTSGTKNTMIQKYDMEFKWYFVPYELTVNNAIWQDAYSKVNLGGFILISRRFDPRIRQFVEEYLFPEGTLLLKKVEVTKYEPFYPFENVNLTQNSSVYDYFTEFNKNQYADVTFQFSYFNYSRQWRIPVGFGNIQNLDCKDPASPHNRLPDPVVNFWYYLESDPVAVRAAPIFWSYPMGNLWNYREGA